MSKGFGSILELPTVTLAALSSIRMYATVQALKYSMQKIKFGDCIFISHRKPFYLPKNIRFEYTTKMKTIEDFNYKMLYELHKYVKTDFVLLVHFDGYVVNPEKFRPEFLDYDYIGSPWPDGRFKDIYGNVIRVGNGVSFRSKKLLELPQKLNIPFEFEEINPEDLFLCTRYRHLLLENGIKYAPLEVAKYFGRELMIPEIEGIEPFVFHKWFGSNECYKNFDYFRYFRNAIKKVLPRPVIDHMKAKFYF